MHEYRDAALEKLNRIGMQALKASTIGVGSGAVIGYTIGCLAGAEPPVSEKLAIVGAYIGGMRVLLKANNG